MNKIPRCALVIGHTLHKSGAANATSGLTEFQFNEALSLDIVEAVGERVNIARVYRDTYASLPNKINKLEPDFIISLHCNAFNRKASGTEVLYYWASAGAITLAETLQSQLVNALGLPDRGTKSRSVDERGGYLLAKTVAPCVIAEPFFIDNDQDLQTARESIDQLVNAYANTIISFAESLGD